MAGEYKSVLKEKKKYEEVIDDRPFLRRHLFGVNFLIVVFILLISFVVYFFNILTPASIFKDDLLDFYYAFDSVFKEIFFDYDLSDNYHIYGEGNIDIESNYSNLDLLNYLDGYKVNYSYKSNKNSNLLELNYDNNKYVYNRKNLEQYIDTLDYKLKLKNLESNVSINTYNKVIEVIKNSIFNYIDTLDFKRSVYVLDGKVVVDVNIELTGKDINDMYSSVIDDLSNDIECRSFINMINSDWLKKKNIVSDDSSYSIQVMNDIFMNDIIEFKLILRDGEYRGLINYNNGEITYNDGVDDYVLNLNFSDKNFEIKINKIDELYSVFSGSGSDSGYVYTYQIINIIDKVSLQIKKGDTIDYIFSYMKETDDEKINLLINFNIYKDEDIAFEENFKEYTKKYSELSDGEKERIKNVNYKVFDYLNELYEYYR